MFISGRIIPRVLVAFLLKLLAITFGLYLLSFIIFRIFCFVSSLTYLSPDSACETVVTDTFAILAMSFIVGGEPFF